MQDTKKDLKEAMEQDTQQAQGREQEREPDFWDEMDQILKDKELSKGPSPFPPTEGLDLEKISYEIRMKARKRAWKRWGSRVACFVLLAFVVVGVVQLWETPAEAGEDNIVDKIEVTDDPIQGPESQGLDLETKESIYQTTNEDEIEQYQKLFPELQKPGYIPEGYIFCNFVLRHFENKTISISYKYKNAEDLLLIRKYIPGQGTDSVAYFDVKKAENVEGGIVYYAEDSLDDMNALYFLQNDETQFSIMSNVFNRDELEKVMNGFIS